jgi:hypothetical protein
MADPGFSPVEISTAVREHIAGPKGTAISLAVLGYLAFLQLPDTIKQSSVNWLHAVHQAIPVVRDLSILNLILFLAIGILLLLLWRSTREAPKIRENPLTHSGERFERYGVKWTPIKYEWGDARDKIVLSDPLCPECLAPLFYAGDGTTLCAECPTCEKVYRFNRGLSIIHELTRRHAIGMAARNEIFRSFWYQAWLFGKTDINPYFHRGADFFMRFGRVLRNG